jgi:succinate dehydrogenase / fumarate reductase, cytochrome b subunit
MSQIPPPPNRPLSPHLQVWRWHVTMLSSILHRITGSASVAGLILVVIWLLALALGRETYTLFVSLAASPLGLLVWFGLTLTGLVHLMGGVRHLIWDTGAGFTPKKADALAAWTMIAGIVLTLIYWAALFVCGKVTLP